jgi:hypothetical protein
VQLLEDAPSWQSGPAVQHDHKPADYRSEHCTKDCVSERLQVCQFVQIHTDIYRLMSVHLDPNQHLALQLSALGS